MNLRRSNPSDVASVLEILYSNSKWLESLGIFQWPLGWMKSQELEFVREIEFGNFYIYAESESIIGVLHLTEEANDLWEGMSGDACYISKIAINRNESGKGIRSQILEKIQEILLASGTSRLRLDCVSNNNKLKSYYEQRGFNFVGRRILPEISLDLYEKHLKEREGSWDFLELQPEENQKNGFRVSMVAEADDGCAYSIEYFPKEETNTSYFFSMISTHQISIGHSAY